jgi:hypothetical protein
MTTSHTPRVRKVMPVSDGGSNVASEFGVYMNHPTRVLEQYPSAEVPFTRGSDDPYRRAVF